MSVCRFIGWSVCPLVARFFFELRISSQKVIQLPPMPPLCIQTCQTGCRERQTDRQTDRWRDGQTNRRTDGQTDGWTFRKTDEQTDRQTDRRTDGRTLIYVDAFKKTDHPTHALTKTSIRNHKQTRIRRHKIVIKGKAFSFFPHHHRNGRSWWAAENHHQKPEYKARNDRFT